jgi:hypothetical protein
MNFITLAAAASGGSALGGLLYIGFFGLMVRAM